ncbi:glycosyltransferase family 4 protein [Pseudomonadota bacterium]
MKRPVTDDRNRAIIILFFYCDAEELLAVIVSDEAPDSTLSTKKRPNIAFLDFGDVFEDFLPHYGVSQQKFATSWVGSGNHAFLTLLQRDIGDVTWHVLSLSPELAVSRHDKIGCRIEFHKSSWLHRAMWRLFYLPRNAWRWRGLYRQYATVASYVAPLAVGFLRALLRNKPDVLFVQSYSSGRFDVMLALARIMRIPLIAYHAGGDPEEYLGEFVRRWTLPHADFLIVSSQDEYDMLARRYDIETVRLELILTPIDTETFRPQERERACKEANLDLDRRYLLFVGRLDDGMKRVSSIIKCFADAVETHPEAELLIVGEGRDGDDLKALADECARDRVRFLGWVSDDELKAALYNSAECLVLASRREGFPTVVGEALACGTPVLSTRVGGIAELVVEGRTGWLVPPGDDDALRSKLSHVLNNPGLAESLRSLARDMAESRVAPGVVSAALKKCFIAGSAYDS